MELSIPRKVASRSIHDLLRGNCECTCHRSVLGFYSVSVGEE
jgi:hypothetical protein